MFRSTNRATIINYDQKTGRKPVIHKNELMPHNPGIFNAVMVGSTGSGKTNVLLNMLFDFLTYDRLYVYANNSEQAVYEKLRERLEDIAEKLDIEPDEIYHFGDSLSEVVTVDEIPDDGKVSIVVFDDFVLEKDQSIIEEFYVRGRHKKCITIYLSQTYSKIPITIRRNSRIFLFWRATRGRDITMFASDAAPEMHIKDFKSMFAQATAGAYNFLYLDTQADGNRKFRRNFDGFPNNPPPYTPPDSKKKRVVRGDDWKLTSQDILAGMTIGS